MTRSQRPPEGAVPNSVRAKGTRAHSALPLKPIAFLILSALESRERHGYAIKTSVERLSEGTLKLDTGTLYRWLARLLDRGWLTRRDATDEPDEPDERRRYYRLTALGNEVVRLERARLRRLVDGKPLAELET